MYEVKRMKSKFWCNWTLGTFPQIQRLGEDSEELSKLRALKKMMKENFSITKFQLDFFKKSTFEIFLAQSLISSWCFCENLFIAEPYIWENGNKMFLLDPFSFLNILGIKKAIGYLCKKEVLHIVTMSNHFTHTCTWNK